MATYYSRDLFLEEIEVVFIFLEDGFIAHIPNFDSKGRLYESGDLIKCDRSTVEEGKGEEAAVILGWGDSKDASVSQGRLYFERLAKWHGHTGDVRDFKVFGHDCSESQLLWPAEDEDCEYVQYQK